MILFRYGPLILIKLICTTISKNKTIYKRKNHEKI